MRWIKLALLMVFFVSTNTTTALAQQGAAYQPIIPPQPTSNEKKIEVVEIFSYGCSHCHRFEPILERWLKNAPDNIEFVRLPAIFSQQLALYARAFYTAEALDVLDKIHKPFFDAIHLQKRRINTEADIAELFAEHGVNKDDFSKTFRSFSVEAKVRRAAELGKRYGVKATPSMVVNGKFITDPGMTNGFKGMLETVDKLVKNEAKG